MRTAAASRHEPLTLRRSTRLVVMLSLLVMAFVAIPVSGASTCAAYSGPVSGDGFRPGDLRLTDGDHEAGLVAEAGDSDLNASFVNTGELPCAPWKVRYRDSNDNGKFDAKERTLHLVNGNTSGVLGIRLMPSTTFGEHVEPGDSDYNKAKKSLTARACRIDHGASLADDEFILSLKSTKAPAKGDVRLTPTASSDAGTRLTAAMNTPFSLCMPLAAHLKHADLNGNGRYDAGDATILDFPNTPGNMTVHVVDVGQGQGIVLEFPDSFAILDAASRFGSQTAFLDYLAALNPARIDHLIITNPDADHAAACNEIFQRYTVAHFYHPGNLKSTDTWKECLGNATQEANLVTHTDSNMNPGDLLALSQHATVQLLNVDAGTSNINCGSLALRLDYGQTSWIFAGDMDCTAENTVISRGYDLDADLLQVGHHGSKTSSCDAWLQAITPAQAFISVGEGNGFQHPTPEALQRLANVGAAVYRTDLHGKITITTDGWSWNIR